jgi:hypothetical protein
MPFKFFQLYWAFVRVHVPVCVCAAMQSHYTVDMYNSVWSLEYICNWAVDG